MLCVLHTLHILFVYFRIENKYFQCEIERQDEYCSNWHLCAYERCLYVGFFVILNYEMVFKIFRYILQELGHGDKVKNVSTL
jgi:hypothetical protein